MLGYRLTPEALKDMAGIVGSLHKKVSSRRSIAVEKALWAACADLARFTLLSGGKLLPDL
jgi:plasmid stabilization system protein ParE